jgi:hypothetical protein
MTIKPVTGNGNRNNEIIQWSCKYLSSHGYTLKSNPPEIVQDTPWSYIVRFATSEGYIYLKQTPKLLALEAPITRILHDQFHASVPEVIAYHSELNCFLMKDAGKPLRGILKQQFDAALLCKAIDQFTSLQLAVADHVKLFLDMGVPDWRLDKLPDLFGQLLAQKDILIADGLSEIEIDELEKLIPKAANLCKRLSEYSIRQSIVQCDFHDNNMLVDDVSQNVTIIDLGEIVISHPFFSLTGCLRQIKKHHALTEKDDAYIRIRNACLKNYKRVESEENISEAFAAAHLLWLVYEMLGQYRLMLACGQARILSYQPGKLRHSLKEFMAASG